MNLPFPDFFVTKQSLMVAMLLITSFLSLNSSAVEKSPNRFQYFITREGDKLINGNQPFRFIGANMPGLVLPYDYTMKLPERLALPTSWEQEDGLKTLDQMNLRVVRTWNLPIRAPGEKPADGDMTWHYVQGPGEFNEESFKVIDQLFAHANHYGVRVIFDFTAEAGDFLGGIGTYAEHRGKTRAEFYTDPQIKEDFKATIRHVIERKNTITGVSYRDDKALLAWQFGNEMNSAPDAWLSEMAAFIKSLDPHHLVAETRHTPKYPQKIDPNIDLYTRHYYANSAEAWLAEIRREVASLKGERPFFIGEFGPYIDDKSFTRENVVGELRAFLEGVQNLEGVSGALLWSMYFHHHKGGYLWHQIFTYPSVWAYHWPGFASAEEQKEIGIMDAMRAAAFRIAGESVPPVPRPDSPELLPIGDVPFLSWRGSSGASGYDIERAPDSQGPWTVIAENVSDADTAYRPLFSDASAPIGRKSFYRVTARNVTGKSKPSNVVGPVLVKSVCLADELQDFSLLHSKSKGLKLNNSFNALYAEYLFRVQGTIDDWVTYKVPGKITSVKVVAFFSVEMGDLKLEAANDGVAFASLKVNRSERQLGSVPAGPARGQTRTMVEYICKVPAGHNFLRIKWTGPSELDRVEIYHK